MAALRVANGRAKVSHTEPLLPRTRQEPLLIILDSLPCWRHRKCILLMGAAKTPPSRALSDCACRQFDGKFQNSET